MKVVSQQRRPLSLKEGLLEIRRSMEQVSGEQPPSAPPPSPPPARARAPKTRSRPPAAPRPPVRTPQPAAPSGERNKARLERNRQFHAIWNVFAKHHPAFRDRLPLKIGVTRELATRHPEYSMALLQLVLGRHVNHVRYHERVAAGGARYELDGSVSTGPGITAEHIARANAALASHRERTGEKKADKVVEPLHSPARAPEL
ncbi:ProQ/FINO family protein [Paraburkholderia sediminicola]|uniref:ProQ/FINO family protein n=1 Tax=Paraburkholderia sediminicola TaxID=458836 RepID=UPI0038BAF44D